MISRIRTRKAFTLVEILVVVLIIGILLAVAIPNFLGQRQRAADRSAQENLRNAVTAVKTFGSDTDSFEGLTAAKLASIEPNIDWEASGVSAGVSGNARSVAVEVASSDSDIVYLAAEGGDGVCWQVNVKLNGDPDAYDRSPATGEGTGDCDASAITDNPVGSKRSFPSS